MNDPATDESQEDRGIKPRAQPETSGRRLKVALCCPMNPRTAIAKHMAQLARALDRLCSVTVFCEPRFPTDWARLYDGLHMVGLDKNGLRMAESYDVLHFQLGNSPFHHFQNHALSEFRQHAPVWQARVATVHESSVGASVSPLCPACQGFAIRQFARAILDPGTRLLLRKTGDALARLPFRYVANDAWQEILDAVVFHSNYALNHSRFQFGRIPTYVLPLVGFDYPIVKDLVEGIPTIFVPALSLGPRRGIQPLVEAVSRNEDAVTLLVSGEFGKAFPKFRAEMEALERQKKGPGRIAFVGHLSESSFLEALRSCAAVAVPREYTLGEASSGIIHALCVGKPVLASRVGANPEYVEDGVNGFLVENSPQDWEAAIRKILDPGVRARLSGPGARWARQRLAPGAVAARHLAMYRDILRQRVESTCRAN